MASLAVAGYWFGIGPGRTAGGLPVDEDGTAAEVATGQVAPGEAGEPEEGAASEPERAPSTAPSPSPEEGKAIASEAPPTAPPPHDEEAVTEPPETLETEPSVADSSRPSGREPGTRDRPPRQPRAERRPPRVRDAEPAPTRNDRTTRTTREEPVQTKLALAVPASPGTFSLNSRPWCRAYLGARELGVTPISAVEVPAGRHTVRCVHPELGERSIQLNVPPGEEVRQSIAWLGELRFRVLPWAMVHVNGEEIGMTPLPPRELPAGRYRVRLVNEQLGVDRTMQIEIRGGETATVDVDLR